MLPEPAPGVTLDGIENGLLIFQAIAYVPSPRMAGGVRSELLFTILERLQDAQLPMAATTAAPVVDARGRAWRRPHRRRLHRRSRAPPPPEELVSSSSRSSRSW